jgi:hypothetical protein
MLTAIVQVLGAFVCLILGAGGLFGFFHDIRENSAEFMNKVITSSPPNFGKERLLASSDFEKVSILYYPVNALNYEFIRGEWIIYNYIDEKDNEEVMNVAVDLELIGNSKVIIDSDKKQIFRISFIGDQSRMALVRKLNNGYEILEMKKVNANTLTAASVKNAVDSKDENHKGVMMIDGELVLEKVMNPQRSNAIYQGQLVKGSLRISGGNINDFEASVSYENGETASLDFDVATINDGGQFQVDIGGEEVQGIFSNNGKDSFRIRFLNGPLAGALLNYVSEEKFEAIEEQELARQENIETESEDRMNHANELVKDKIEEQDQVADQRSAQAKVDSEELVEPNAEDVTPEEMADRVRKSGFDFGQAAPAPSPITEEQGA